MSPLQQLLLRSQLRRA
jgi:hypothetical protein